jgi:hypothetical protein
MDLFGLGSAFEVFDLVIFLAILHTRRATLYRLNVGHITCDGVRPKFDEEGEEIDP